MGVNSLPKTASQLRFLGPSAPERSTLTTPLASVSKLIIQYTHALCYIVGRWQERDRPVCVAVVWCVAGVSCALVAVTGRLADALLTLDTHLPLMPRVHQLAADLV